MSMCPDCYCRGKECPKHILERELDAERAAHEETKRKLDEALRRVDNWKAQAVQCDDRLERAEGLLRDAWSGDLYVDHYCDDGDGQFLEEKCTSCEANRTPNEQVPPEPHQVGCWWVRRDAYFGEEGKRDE